MHVLDRVLAIALIMAAVAAVAILATGMELGHPVHYGSHFQIETLHAAA